MAGRAVLFPHAATRCRWRSPAASGSAARNPIVFGAFGGFADDARVENGSITLSNRPGIGFEGQAALYRIMRELAGI
jgi:D(-)-tartrate dehydratase